MNESDKFERLFNILLYSFAGFYLIFSFIFSKVSEKTKEKILHLLFISSPIWLILSLYQLLSRIPFILTDQIDPFIDFFTLLTFLALISTYFLLANWPATFAYVIIHSLPEISPSKEIQRKTFWSLLDALKIRRLFVLIFLIACLILIIFLNVSLFLRIDLNLNSSITNLLLLCGIFLIFLFLFADIMRYGYVDIKRGRHKRGIDLKRAVENLSIAAGVQPPNCQILAHTSPNAFSICCNFGKPTIFATTALLNLANKDELEAVIGHEIAHIFSERIFDYRSINNLLTLLRIFSFLLFLLMLLTINPLFLAVWMGVLGYMLVSGSLETVEWSGDTKSFFDTAIALCNPPFLFINFLSYILYYGLSFNEEFYADTKAVQLTRCPKGLYSILKKIENYKGFTDQLPQKYYHLYFTGEGTTLRLTSMPQPPIKKRKKLLEEIDYTLKHLNITKTTDLKCPYCNNLMEELEEVSHHGVPVKIDRCLKCGSVWFDNWELWYIADLTMIAPCLSKELAPKKRRASKVALFPCPRCGVALSLFIDPNIPLTIEIWRCPSCNGNWLMHEEICEYGLYRKRRLKKR